MRRVSSITVGILWGHPSPSALAQANRRALSACRSSSPSLRSLLNDRLRLHHPDVWQVSVTLAVIEPIAHDEFIGNLETDVLQIDFNDAAGPAIQQRANF